MAAPGNSGVGGAVSFPALEQAIRESVLQSLPEAALSKFRLYLDLLLKWNSRLNLTAIRDRDLILRRHFIECIQCAQSLPGQGVSLLDFGSGAGLPGIPIAICRPDISVTLAESQRKKAGFLREAVRSLELSANVFDGRVEDMAAERTFDFVTLRAVDKMKEACRSGAHRVSPGGWIVVFATEDSELRLKEALPGFLWQPDLRTRGLDQGLILLGNRIA